MPALIHCHRPGAHKARIVALRVGSYTYAETRAEAHGLYQAARALGYRVSVFTVEPGCLRVTLLAGTKTKRPNHLTTDGTDSTDASLGRRASVSVSSV